MREAPRLGAVSGNRWVKVLAGGPDSTTILVCFHHAGGAAGSFRSWAPYLAPDTMMLAVQLPGRSERFREKAFDRMPPVVDGVLEHVVPLLDRPFSFFGFSMGARVALATAQALRRREQLPGPDLLMVASSPGPALRTPVPGWDRGDEELTEYLVETGGVPDVAAVAEVLDLMLPTVRADLTVVASWPYQEGQAVSCPIAAFAGRDDPYAGPAQMAHWAVETSAAFSLTEFDGGHFFTEPSPGAAVAAVNGLLAGLPPVLVRPGLVQQD